MADELVLTVMNQLSEIERITQSVEEFAERHDLSPKVAFAVHLALEELLVNTISYGYVDSATHRIDIRITIDGGMLMARVEDDAQPFDPTQYPAPDMDPGVEDRNIGGLGIHLVRGLVDALEYRRHGEKNLLVIKKNLVAP